MIVRNALVCISPAYAGKLSTRQPCSKWAVSVNTRGLISSHVWAISSGEGGYFTGWNAGRIFHELPEWGGGSGAEAGAFLLWAEISAQQGHKSSSRGCFFSLKCSPGASPVPESVEGPAWFVLCFWPCWLRPSTSILPAVLRALPEGPGCLLPFSLSSSQSSRLPTHLIPFTEHLWLLLTQGDCFKPSPLLQLPPSPNGSHLKESKSSSSASAPSLFQVWWCLVIGLANIPHAQCLLYIIWQTDPFPPPSQRSKRVDSWYFKLSFVCCLLARFVTPESVRCFIQETIERVDEERNNAI